MITGAVVRDAYAEGTLQGLGVEIDSQVYRGYIISDKSDEGHDTSSRVEMGNPK